MENSERFNSALGIASGASTYYCVKKFASRPINKFLMNKGLNYTPEENEQISKGLNKALTNSGLKEKGVTIVHVDKVNQEQILLDFTNKLEEIVKDWVHKYFPKKEDIKVSADGSEASAKLEQIMKMTSKGKNAFYHPITKQIMINTQELPFAAFHEMGHAMNHNFGKFTNFLHWGRHGFAWLAPIFVGIGLLKNKKQEGEKPQGTGDKITTFIKNNCGKLAFLAMVPTMVEEGLASYNGAKLAKKVVSPELFKKICKSNALCWGTYLVLATMTGLGANLAIKARDKIVEPKSES